jgi:SAM-dependent methyltransferase
MLRMEPLQLSTRDGYGRWAEDYDGEGNPLAELEEPEMNRRLGDVGGLALLDVGCGTGLHALRLAACGVRVTAVDFSTGMLARAATKSGAERVRFVEHDLAQPLPFESGAFDRVVCALVLDHVVALTPFFGELRRVARRDGRASPIRRRGSPPGCGSIRSRSTHRTTRWRRECRARRATSAGRSR